VKQLNNARLNTEPFHVASAFRRASEHTSSDKQQAFISSCWGLLARMLGIQKANLGLLEPRHFSKIYAQSSRQENNDEVIRFRTKLVHGGREWLEETFRQMVTQYVRDNHYEIGGLPSVHTEVHAFLKIKYFRNGRWTLSWLDHSIGKIPFWAHVYLLVRMGKLKDALEYIQKYSSELSQSKDSNFMAYFRAWINAPDGRLPKALRDSLFGEWNARIRDYVSNAKSTPKGDVFKYALYKLIGRCDLNVKAIRNSEVIQTTDDFLWIHTMLISEDTYSTDATFEKYSLCDFSASMQKFGKAHFQKTDVWFMVLMICGEFEKAVNELSNEPFFAIDAVHFAVAMAYFGVMNVPENPKEIPISNTLLSCRKIKQGNHEYEVYAFHFARMVAHLVKEWVRSDPAEMMHYVFLLGLFGKPLDGTIPENVPKSEWEHGREYTRFVLSLIKDVLTQSGKTTELMGHLRSDGRGRTPGPVEQYRSLINLNSEQEFLDRIILSCAEQCDREGRIKDALELYNLSCQPNKVIELLIRQVGESLLTNAGPVSQTESGNGSVFAYQDPVETATNVLNYYMSRSQEAASLNPRLVFTCRTLMTLAKFRESAGLGQFEHSLELFYSLDVVPSVNDMNLIQKKAQSFSGLDESICRVLPATLVVVATVLSQLYQQISQSRLPERETRLQNLKQRMKAILTFCGLVQYQIPGETFAKINRMDVMMG
jgi:nuclear pore complex protein Nup93